MYFVLLVFVLCFCVWTFINCILIVSLCDCHTHSLKATWLDLTWQAVSRVTREQCSSLFHFTAVSPSALLPIPGNPVRHDPAPTELPWIPLSRFPRGYRGIPAVPITMQTSTVHWSSNNSTISSNIHCLIRQTKTLQHSGRTVNRLNSYWPTLY